MGREAPRVGGSGGLEGRETIDNWCPLTNDDCSESFTTIPITVHATIAERLYAERSVKHLPRLPRVSGRHGRIKEIGGGGGQ